MAYRINDNTERILSEHKGKTVLAVRFGIDDIQRIADPKTPKKKGLLRGDVIKKVTGTNGSIRWRRKYAGAQEAGRMTVHKTRTFKMEEGQWMMLKPGVYHFRRYTTPGTGAHFADNAAKAVGDNPGKYFRMARI